MTAAEVPWVAIVGLAGLATHLSLTKALQLADASLMMPVDFLRLPLMTIVGVLAYAESIDVLIFVGAAMIVAGNYYSIRREGR